MIKSWDSSQSAPTALKRLSQTVRICVTSSHSAGESGFPFSDLATQRIAVSVYVASARAFLALNDVHHAKASVDLARSVGLLTAETEHAVRSETCEASDAAGCACGDEARCI